MRDEDLSSAPRLISRITRFVFVGGATSVGYVILVAVLVDGFWLRPDLSAAISYVVMLPVNFLGHKHVTYRSKRPPFREAAAFLGMHAVTAAICAFVMWLVTGPFGAIYWIGSAAIVVIAPLANLLMMEFWVFAAKHNLRRD